MLLEKATALVVRTSDWSESSRIATLFTREFGKVRVLAKGGRRLRSNFEVALDLLTLCGIVLIRKSSGLDLLTEARADERFPGLRVNLHCLYAGYYVAELLGEGTQDHDPHPALFDVALRTLRALNEIGNDSTAHTLRFELAWLDELGYRPRLDACAVCDSTDWLNAAAQLGFGASRRFNLPGLRKRTARSPTRQPRRDRHTAPARISGLACWGAFVPDGESGASAVDRAVCLVRAGPTSATVDVSRLRGLAGFWGKGQPCTFVVSPYIAAGPLRGRLRFSRSGWPDATEPPGP